MVLCPWDSPCKNYGVGCHTFLQGIFPTQGSNQGLPHCRWILYQLSVQFSHSIVSDSLRPPWTAACQASLSITNSWSLLKLMSIESVMPSNSLILCHPFLLLPSIFPSIRVVSSESVLCIRWPKYWSFSFSISPSNVYSGLISFRMDWLDLLAVQGTLKNLLQHHSYQLSHQDGPQPYIHYKYINVYHIYVTFPPLITFWGYCPAHSLPSLQCYSCMDCLQLSLRGQLFLTHFCVSSPDTGAQHGQPKCSHSLLGS